MTSIVYVILYKKEIQLVCRKYKDAVSFMERMGFYYDHREPEYTTHDIEIWKNSSDQELRIESWSML